MSTATRRSALLIAILLLTLAPVAGQEGKTPKQINLDNLQTALNGEFSARAKYRAFAAKADEEGFGQAAALFRACARAEEIHAGLFMSLIRARGGSGTAMMEGYEVKSTKENLEQAFLWEKTERDQLYPSFAADADVANDRRAAKVFRLVRDAETEHSNLCRDAANNLEAATEEIKPYWVCHGCGYTTPVEPRGACPICGAKASELTEIR